MFGRSKRTKENLVEPEAEAPDLAEDAPEPLAPAIEQEAMRGPSPNPATNLMIHDVALRVGGRMLRTSLEKGLLSNRYGQSRAKEMIDGRSGTSALASYLATRMATRSLPGAIVVGTGLFAKTMFDRSRAKRRVRREAERALRKQKKLPPAD
ncbi:hypothetical protein [Tsuneonella mangrovi]|uniref:hypothetical protein n=1 Tax=Tsuneonella mangrovi TaxID=1982042 RepID=UPI000BA29B2E|nr:hypothetical protein [Tsuneonella mangrovi]